MSRKEKLLKRFLSMPKDFCYGEAVKLLNGFEFYEVNTGKTSGSRVRFENDKLIGLPILLHKPHPSNILKSYQLKSILNDLIYYGLLKMEEDEGIE